MIRENYLRLNSLKPYLVDETGMLKEIGYHDGTLELVSRREDSLEFGILDILGNRLLIKVDKIVEFYALDLVVGSIVDNVNIVSLSKQNWWWFKEQINVADTNPEAKIERLEANVAKGIYSFFYIDCSYGASIGAIIKGGREKVVCYA
jgi:hypothetical protein